MPGWQLHNVADHCSMRSEIDTQLFPKKPTSWLTFGHMPDIGRLPQCNDVCSCTIPGTSRHKFFICNNNDMHEKQIVIKNVFAKGRIPLRAFQRFFTAFQRGTRRTPSYPRPYEHALAH